MARERRGWIAFDLDGTLAHYDGWVGIDHIGEPVPAMVSLLHDWRVKGYEVRVFTARVCRTGLERKWAKRAIQDWCRTHLGFVPKITNVKDFGMIRLYDDRCIQVEENTGRLIGESHD